MYEILTITFVQSSFHVLTAASVGIFSLFIIVVWDQMQHLSLSVFCNLCKY